MEGEIGNKKKEIDSLKAKQVEIEKKDEFEQQWLKMKQECEKKTCTLNEALKSKNKQLVEHLRRGGKTL